MALTAWPAGAAPDDEIESSATSLWENTLDALPLLLAVVVLLAMAVTFPSVKPVDVLAGLGFFSVAVGFAFQDILENTLAGVLLLFRQPFRSGDQVKRALEKHEIEMPADIIALQATPSFSAALRGSEEITPGGNLRTPPT